MSFREFNYMCPECRQPMRWMLDLNQYGCDNCDWRSSTIPYSDINAASQETQIVESDDDIPDNPDDPEADEFPVIIRISVDDSSQVRHTAP